MGSRNEIPSGNETNNLFVLACKKLGMETANDLSLIRFKHALARNNELDESDENKLTLEEARAIQAHFTPHKTDPTVLQQPIEAKTDNPDALNTLRAMEKQLLLRASRWSSPTKVSGIPSAVVISMKQRRNRGK